MRAFNLAGAACWARREPRWEIALKNRVDRGLTAA
jgi:hypothetical protein